jgi:hypothetical protein
MKNHNIDTFLPVKRCMDVKRNQTPSPTREENKKGNMENTGFACLHQYFPLGQCYLFKMY